MKKPCLSTRAISAPCSQCHRYSDRTHFPDDTLQPYCEACCPTCKPKEEPYGSL